MKIEAYLYGDLMEKFYLRWRALRYTAAESAEEFYGFHYNHVACVHCYKHGEGEGFWFRLHDGRVFDMLGHPDVADPIWYDKKSH